MRAITAVVGGTLAGLGLGGGVAAIIDVNRGIAGTFPIVIAGVGFGLGIGLLVASAVQRQSR